jgi:hypothetical protein
MVWLILVLVVLVACGVVAWGLAGAVTNLALASGIAASQTSIAVLVMALVAMMGLLVFSTIRAFQIGRESVRSLQEERPAPRLLERPGSRLPETSLPLQLEPPKTIQPSRPKKPRRSRGRTSAIHVARGFK